MQIEVNKNNEIICYSRTGGLNDGIDIPESVLPAEFTTDFVTLKYLYVNGGVTDNPNFAMPKSEVGPSPEMQAINALGLVVAQMQEKEAKSNV